MSIQNKSTWIWYPGDFEVWLNMKVSTRRTERGRTLPPFWRVDTCYPCVKFRKRLELLEDEEIVVHAEGEYNLSISDSIVYTHSRFTIPKGRNDLVITVYNPESIPAIFIQGNTVISDETWEVSCGNQVWIKAGSWNFDSIENKPSGYRLSTTEIFPESVEQLGPSCLYDFGKETFGYIVLKKIEGYGKATIYYGESKEEALSKQYCELLDSLEIKPGSKEVTLSGSRAFRYVNIEPDSTLAIGDVSALYEYLPVEYKGKFRCSDARMNNIWDTSVYTLHLNTREFFIDGIKRDRWVWSGDAYQSFLMNYYSFFDLPVTKRTILALRGKDPVETHINQIMDYSFFWFMGLYDYYLYTGDMNFVKECYPKAEGLIQFCLDRRNENGMMEGYPEDWVFVDWDDMNKEGELSFEQILLCRSLEIMGELSYLIGYDEKGKLFTDMGEELKAKINEVFWDEEQGAFINDRCKGLKSKHVTKYSNMFAVMLGYVDGHRAETIKNKVLLNDSVQTIKTPYMRFYELAALCEINEHNCVASEISSYWGGMLNLKATSFWEKYDPARKDSEQYEMYGRHFGKSLCHAWGASPIYLLGKYFLGVKPSKPGYKEYIVEPHLGGLEWVEGVVPAPDGEVNVYMDRSCIRVRSTCGMGILRFNSSTEPDTGGKPFERELNGKYRLIIEAGNEIEVKGRFDS